MLNKVFEILFFIFTILSFFATSYTPPWTSSSMEFFAFLALFSLFLSIPLKSHELIISESFIFSVVLLIVAWILFIFNENKIYEKMWMFSLYITAFSLYVNCVYLKGEGFYSIFSVAIIFSAIFNVFVILSQYFDIYSNDFGIWIAGYSQNLGRPYGNFGQPNLVSTLILMGLCFSVFLHSRKIIGILTLFLVSAFFGGSLAFPSSKTALLCLVIMAVVSIFLKDWKSFFAFFLAFILFLFFKKIIPNTRDIVGTELSTGRFELWKMMFYALWEEPWSGYGALNTRIAHFQVRELDLVPRDQVIGASHNIFLDYLIWFGMFFGIFISLMFVKLIFNYLNSKKYDPPKVYIIFPILIHSQLEFPLYYANFLFMFAFVVGGSNGQRGIMVKKFPIIFMASVFILFFAVVYDYRNISGKYTEFRFFKNNFHYAKKPLPIEPWVLDLNAGQVNIMLKEKIDDANDLKYIVNITKSMPSFRNYYLIIKYLNERNHPKEEIDFWMNKAKASFNEREFSVLENIN